MPRNMLIESDILVIWVQYTLRSLKVSAGRYPAKKGICTYMRLTRGVNGDAKLRVQVGDIL